jgi:hypothetical protein
VILSLTMPRVGAQMRQGQIHKLLVRVGDALKPGTPLLEVRVDLGSANAQDCPPLFFFRLIATERGVLRSLDVSLGDVLDVGAKLGVAASDGTESIEAKPARALRTTSVAIQIDPLSRR